MSNTETNTTETNTSDETPEQSLDEFAAELFGDSTPAPENANSEDATEESEEVSGESGQQDTSETVEEGSSEEQGEAEEAESPEEEDALETETDEAKAEEDKPKPKKNRFQERIDELTAARKEAERKLEEQTSDLKKQMDELRSQLEGNKEEKTETEKPTTTAPKSDDKKEDGSPKYPLGEYDPQFMRDTVEHMFAEKEAEQEQKAAQTEQQRQEQLARQELQTEWNGRLDTARERYPDFQQKGEEMVAVFDGIDEQYGEYLTTTLMEMEAGADVLYYLANNIPEAQRIVAKGPKGATMALAKLETQLGNVAQAEPEKPKTPKVTKAKTPPPQNKGSAVVAPKVAVDTDDLDAFSKELFR